MLNLSEFIPPPTWVKQHTSPWDPKEDLQKSEIASHEPYTSDIAPIKKMIDEGGARPSDSPWASLLVLVKKTR